MPKYLKSGNISERDIQKTTMEWVKLHHELNGLVFSFPNEVAISVHRRKLLIDMGMRPGVSDLFVMMMRHNYGGAWIELKSLDGSLKPHQDAFLKDAEKQGYFTSVCWSADEAIEILQWYCFDK